MFADPVLPYLHQAVTGSMFFKENKEASKEIAEGDVDDIPQNVTDIQTDADSVDLEANASFDSLSPIPNNDVEAVAMTTTSEHVLGQEMENPCVAPAEQSQLTPSQAALHPQQGLMGVRRELPWQMNSSATLDDNLMLPSFEESKDEEQQVLAPNLFLSPNFVSSVSFRKNESENVDDDEENLCAICLSGYSKCLLAYVGNALFCTRSLISPATTLLQHL